ncbi:replication factor A protein 3 [Daedaleopsis nitida]|nr:replication factor A protein 3 [Daedaleopsis nitida]
MANYIGQSVRLIAKLINLNDESAIVQASDGGEVEVKLLMDFESPGTTYLEIIGQVADSRTLKMQGYVNLGDDVDMKLAEQIVQIWHDPKFSKLF